MKERKEVKKKKERKRDKKTLNENNNRLCSYVYKTQQTNKKQLKKTHSDASPRVGPRDLAKRME